MKRGENLQRLTYTLERAINNVPTVRMASPQRFRDKDTGRAREHDVGITFSLNHHTLVVALECRDRKRKVDVPAVEAFKRKCDRTGVDKGIIVSSSGFTETALVKAKADEIGCMTLDEAERFNWCLAPGIEQTTRKIVWGPNFRCDTAEPFESEATLYDGHDQVVDGKAGYRIAIQCLDSRTPEEAFKLDTQARTTPVSYTIDNVGASSFYLIDKQGRRVPLTRMLIQFVYQVESKLIPFTFHQYADLSKGSAVTAAAIAEITHGDVSGTLVMHKDDEGITVSFVPRSLSATAPPLPASKKKREVRRRK